MYMQVNQYKMVEIIGFPYTCTVACFLLQIILCVGALPFVWKLSGRIIGHFGFSSDYEVNIQFLTLK